jgi:dihydroorotate dehydrogenase electron transfer subunit
VDETSEVYRSASIRELREEARDTRTFVLDCSLPAEPGQFVMLWIPRLDEKPFCVADDAPLALTVRRVGPLTEELFERRPGDRLRLRGPLGRGFSLRGRRILLIGGGYGAAPLGFLCKRARAAGIAATLAVGARTAGDLLVPESARAFAAEIHLATEDGSAGSPGLVTDVARDLMERGPYDCVYACGPNSMLDSVRRIAGQAGLEAQLAYERYMRCGIGICGSCERDGRLVCSDGPVLRIEPDGTVG